MAPQVTKKRRFIMDGVFYAEMNEFFMRELPEEGYAGVEVRVGPSKTEVRIRATRPQNVIGEKSRRILELTALVQKRFSLPEDSIALYAEKINNRGLCAIAQAESLRYKLLQGIAVRRACYGVLRFVMESNAKVCTMDRIILCATSLGGFKLRQTFPWPPNLTRHQCVVVQGCEVAVSGKLRAQRAKTMKFVDGYMLSSGQPVKEYVQYAFRHVLLRQGVLGIKVRRHLCRPLDMVKLGPSSPEQVWDMYFRDVNQMHFVPGLLLFQVKIMLPYDPSGQMGPSKSLPDTVLILEPKEEPTSARPVAMPQAV